MNYKVLIPAALQIVVGIILWLITGHQEFLIATLTGLTTGGIGFSVPSLPGVTQQDVKEVKAAKHAHGKNWRKHLN